MKKEEIILEDIKQFEVLRQRRLTLEADWNDIVAYVLPSKDFFGTEDPDQTPYTNPEKYDGTAVRANAKLASVYMNGLVNQGTKWFRIDDPDQKDQIEFVQTYGDLDILFEILEEQEKAMYKVLNKPTTGFYRAAHEMMKEITSLGTAPVELKYVFGEGIKFKSVGLTGIFIASDKDGNIDTIYHRFYFTARQAAQEWGLESLGESMREALEQHPHKKFEIIRVIKPVESFLKKQQKQKFTSKYIDKSNKHLLSEGHLSANPFLVSRWDTFTNQDYGVGQAWYALPEILMLQDLTLMSWEVFQTEANKNLLVAHDSVMMPSNTSVGGSIYGGLNAQGQPLVRPLERGGRPDMFDAAKRELRENIQRTFNDNSLSSQELPRMTELEVATRREEINDIVSPNSRRIETEFLMPALQMMYEMMLEHDLFPEIPKEYLKFFAGRNINIKFTGALARTADIQETNIMRNWFQGTIMPAAQIDPKVLDNIDLNEYVRLSGKGQGVPLSIINSKVVVLEKERMRQENEEAQIQAQLQAQVNKEQPNV